MNNSFAITATQLKKFNEKAFVEGQNRVLSIQDKWSNPSANDEPLDMEKKAIVTPMLYHTNHKGVRAWRCQVVFGVEGQEEPRTAYLDLPLCFRRELLKTPVKNGVITEPLTGGIPLLNAYDSLEVK